MKRSMGHFPKFLDYGHFGLGPLFFLVFLGSFFGKETHCVIGVANYRVPSNVHFPILLLPGVPDVHMESQPPLQLRGTA